MKIVFLSNFYNHHQAYVSRKLYELTGGNYYFVSTSKVPSERKQLGYKEISDPFVLYYGEDETANTLIQKKIDAADVVITGSAPEFLLKNRKKTKKLIFRYAERPLKLGFQWWKYPYRWMKWHMDNQPEKSIYMLCASAYTAADYAKFGMFCKRAYKWGYFPECRKYEDSDMFFSQKDPCEIIWCGRFLDWKHPNDLLTIAKRLKNENYQFHISAIGSGEMEPELKRQQEQDGLEDVVTFLGSVDSGAVRKYMERAGIYLFTSDRKEGWGAVLNEAMNSGCAVVASSSAGATPYLVQHRNNGYIYESGDVDRLYEYVKFLLDHPEEQYQMGKSAYETIVLEWNSDIAAERLIKLLEQILGGDAKPDLYQNGPCSRA